MLSSNWPYYITSEMQKLERELAEKTNEVSRLRELLNRAIEIADEAITPLQRSEYSMDGDMLYRQLERLRDEVAPLAPAPEEPVTGLCLICHENQTTCSSGLCDECSTAEEPVIQDSRITEPVDDWKCPHCGSTTGTWFSRVEPMGDICEDCGKSVDEEPAPEWRELGPLPKSEDLLEALRDEIQKIKCL